MKPEDIEKCRSIHAKGMLRYVVTSGLLAWGLPMFVIMTFVVHRERLTPFGLAVSVVVWSLGGVLFGAVMWFLNESRFRKAEVKDGSDPPVQPTGSAGG